MLLFSSLLAFAVTVNAQSEVVTVHVPFAFEAGAKLLPAGNYRVDRAEGSSLLVIHGDSGNSAAFLTMATESNAPLQNASLVFAREGGTLVLSEIHLPGQQSRILFASHAPMKGGVAAVSVSSR
jgi:hypothetical protein